jgi:hypothetical protein
MYSYVVIPKKEMYTWKRQRCSRSPAVIAARIPKELTTTRNRASLIGNTEMERKVDCFSEVVVLLKLSHESHPEPVWYNTSSAIHTATTIKEAATAETTHTTNAA